jgi:hypothetical protein
MRYNPKQNQSPPKTFKEVNAEIPDLTVNNDAKE